MKSELNHYLLFLLISRIGVIFNNIYLLYIFTGALF